MLRTALRPVLAVLLLGCGPQLGAGADGPGAAEMAPRRPAVPYLGRIARDGRAFVAKKDGSHFLWRGVSEFLLAHYLYDPARPAGEGEALALGRIDARAAQGFSVLRVFGMVDWGDMSPVHLRPTDDPGRYQAAMRRLLELSRDRGLYVEWVLFTDVGKTIARDQLDAHVDFAAQLAQGFDNTFVEIANEGWKSGLSDEDILRLGRRFKGQAKDVLVAGGAARDQGKTFAADPFDYVTLHGDRGEGDDGWRWVRRLTEGNGAAADRPVVEDEPMGSAAMAEPGRRDSSAARFRAAALVCHASRQYFTFHHECALVNSSSATCADVPTPGAAEVRRSDLISGDPRDGRYVDGLWPEAPFDLGGALEKGALLGLSSKVLGDGSGFFSYPLYVKQDLRLGVRAQATLTIVDAASGDVRSSMEYKAGATLDLAAGSDVVLIGGPSKPVDPPPPPPPMDPVPVQTGAADVVVRGYSGPQATTIVHRLYQALLGRDADPSGLMSYQPLVAGGRLPRVASILVQSGEFEARRPSLTVQKMSAEFYQAILGRAPDPGGDAGTQAAIRDSHAAQRVTDMVLSPEYEAGRL